jgi:CheY-like chemotaxis protein
VFKVPFATLGDERVEPAPPPKTASPPPAVRPSPVADTETDPLELRNKLVLVIDDDRWAQTLLTNLLKSHGGRVTVAGDAVSAISVARKEAPDLILLDLGLPGGGGMLVLERLMQMHNLMLTPVIVVSASDPSTHRAKAIAAGAQAFLQKPVMDRDLFAAIRKCME